MKVPIDYVLTVHRKTTAQGIDHASGVVLDLPKSDFVDNADWQSIFKRWMNATSNCEIEPVRSATLSIASSIFRTAVIEPDYVGGTLLEGRLNIEGDRVILNTNLVAFGKHGADFGKYLLHAETVTIRPRFIYDTDGKITGVPAWDLVLPSGWNYKPFIYNDVSDEEFFTGLTELVDLCAAKQVSWAIHYSEPTKDWYFQISSAAVSECFIGKNKMLKHALEDAVKHVENIGK